MVTYLILALITCVVIIVQLWKKKNLSEGNYDKLLKKNIELEKFRGYKEEVEQLRQEILRSLPKGIEKMASLWVDLNDVFDKLESEYELNKYQRKRRSKLSREVQDSLEVRQLKEEVRENKALKYRLEMAEGKYILCMAKLKNKYGEENIDALWANYLKSIIKEREEQEEELNKLRRKESLCKYTIERLNKDIERLTKDIEELIREKTKITKEIEELSTDVKKEILDRIEDARFRLDSETDTPDVLKKIAKAWVDYKYIIWDRHIKHLLTKPRPISIETATEFRKKFKEFKDDILTNYKETEYKYNYLISLFPDLQEYIDGEAVLEDSNEIEEHEDRRQGYLTKEEWKSLSEAEKSQLALDRYNEKRKRSKAQVGRDYEEYIAHLFRQQLKGCNITMFGEQRGLEDLGRDLIVQHRSKVYIVQCKRWSEDKVIREKHIMQLFGSTIEYCWDTRRGGMHPLDVVGKTIIPVFVSTTELSDTASRFAERLDVVVAQEPMGEYPQIKCNIGKDGEKIYHLPFDQQYNSTVIEHHKGEFYAWSVEEAERAGYRRAQRYYYN